jgi:hypothetical protein
MKKQLFFMFVLLVFLIGSAGHAAFIDNQNGTVTDTETDLTWQKDTARDGQGAYRLVTWEEALYYCDTLDLGNFQDWRSPTVIELETLVDLTVTNPSIDTDFFPGTGEKTYWTSTTVEGSRNYAWTIDFTDGSDSTISKTSNAAYVRAVRGGVNIPKPAAPFVANKDGTITDTRTGLVWTKETARDGAGYRLTTWEDALGYCEGLDLAGRSRWRLPTIDELESIIDLSVCVPAVNTLFFPDTRQGDYWTSTTYDGSRSSAWVIDFSYGSDGSLYKTSRSAYVRAVYGGLTTILYVSKTAGCGGNTPCYQSIQAALDDAEDGTIIKVGGGIYLESPRKNRTGKAIISGGWDSQFKTQISGTTRMRAPGAPKGSLTVQEMLITP